MLDKNLINTFETISNFENFSKYNSILDHEFKDKSLKSFIISLKHYKPKEKENFIEEFYKKYPYQFEEKKLIEDDDSFMENIKGLKNITINEKDNEKNSDKQIKFRFENQKTRESEIPDSLRYSPNYDSIFKKIQSFKMGYDKKFNLKNKKEKNKQIINSSNTQKTKLFKNKNKLTDKNKIEKQNNLFKTNIRINDINNKNNIKSKKDIFLNLPPISIRNINNTKDENNKNKNHNTLENKSSHSNFTFRLNKYKSRNEKFEAENYKKLSEHLSYNNNNAVDFGKMSSRNDKYLINAYSLDVPSSEKYRPKYSYTEDNVKNIIFSPFGSNKKSKKILLRKMMSSYNVPTEYQYIDNEKLTTDKDLINKLLILKYNNYLSK